MAASIAIAGSDFKSPLGPLVGACLLLSSACAFFFRARFALVANPIEVGPGSSIDGDTRLDLSNDALHFVLRSLQGLCSTPFMAHF